MKTGTELPVNVKFILEGEEEIGSPNLVPFIEKHKDLLECDMVLISDTAMFGENQPSITYGLRGLAYMEVRSEERRVGKEGILRVSESDWLNVRRKTTRW